MEELNFEEILSNEFQDVFESDTEDLDWSDIEPRASEFAKKYSGKVTNSQAIDTIIGNGVTCEQNEREDGSAIIHSSSIFEFSEEELKEPASESFLVETVYMSIFGEDQGCYIEY